MSYKKTGYLTTHFNWDIAFKLDVAREREAAISPRVALRQNFRLEAKFTPSCFGMGEWKGLRLAVVAEYDCGLPNLGRHEEVIS